MLVIQYRILEKNNNKFYFYVKALSLSNVEFDGTKHQKMLTLHWEADDDHLVTTQEIKMFTLVSCVLEKGNTGPLALKVG